MRILVMGHRQPLARTLKQLDIPFILWSERPIKNKTAAIRVLIAPFPENEEDLLHQLPEYATITHVIATIEKSVIPASNIRLWLKLKRNPHSLILKCTDKLKMKRYLFEKDIPMTEFCSSFNNSSEEIINKLGLPLVSKPKLSSGGRGIIFINSLEELEQSKSRSCYYEKVISGKEGSIESFIYEGEIIFSNITEYFKNGLCNKVPGRYDDEIIKKIKELNDKVIKSLNIKWGITHLEYYIVNNELLFGEVALRPPGGYIMELMSEVYTLNAWETFAKVELGLFIDQEIKQIKFGASLLIHPQEGVVTAINGESKVREIESLNLFKLKLKVKDTISKREGVGENYGHAFFFNETSRTIDRDINYFYKTFSIEMKEKENR